MDIEKLSKDFLFVLSLCEDGHVAEKDKDGALAILDNIQKAGVNISKLYDLVEEYFDQWRRWFATDMDIDRLEELKKEIERNGRAVRVSRDPLANAVYTESDLDWIEDTVNNLKEQLEEIEKKREQIYDEIKTRLDKVIQKRKTSISKKTELGFSHPGR